MRYKIRDIKKEQEEKRLSESERERLKKREGKELR